MNIKMDSLFQKTWNAIALPSIKVIVSYYRQFPDDNYPQKINHDVIFFSGDEIVDEARVLQCIMSGWNINPKITNLKFSIQKY